MKRIDTSSAAAEHNWPANPYPGLRPFLIKEDSDESLIFFGRKEQIHDLLDRLGSTHFMAVLGPSGCGKSSLVKAGLIPALSSGLIYQAGANWVSAEAEPGSAPIQNLAGAIAGALKRAGRKEAKAPSAEELAERMHASTTALVDLADELPKLLEDNTNLLILVDQFEEIFREDLAQRDEDAQLINLLLNVFNMRPEGLYVVITMRTDYLEQCATFHGLPEALNQSQFLTPRLNAQQLAEAISGPAELRQYGGKVEPRLARKILGEMTSSSGYDPDLLPLMQHALFWMWRNAVDRERPDGEPILLTLEDYQELAGDNGLQGVLAKRADDIFDTKLDPEQQRIAECMFRLMSEVDDGARRRRRVTSPEEVALNAGVDLADARAVIDIFADEAVSFIRWKDDGATLDVTHESLIRKWGRLDAWALEERVDAEEYRDLEKAAAKWAEDNRATLTEAGLQRWEEFQQKKGNVRLWAARYGGAFEAVSEYVDVSKARVQENIERRERSERLQHEFEQSAEREKAAKQSVRRLYAIGAVLLVLIIGAVGASFYILNLKELADSRLDDLRLAAVELEQKKDEAEAAKQLAENKTDELKDASVELKKKNIEAGEQRKKAIAAKLLAEAEAATLTKSLKTNARLVELSKKAITLRRAAIVEKEVDEGRPATGLRLALDTKDIATEAERAYHLALARAVTAAPRPGTELIGKFGTLSSVRWNEEEGGWTVLWQNGVENAVKAPNALSRPFKITPAQALVLGSLSPDLSMALVAKGDGSAMLVGRDTNERPVRLTNHTAPAVEAEYSDDGTSVATLSEDRRFGVWDTETGDQQASLGKVEVDVFSLSSESARLVTATVTGGSSEGENISHVRVWSLDPNAVFQTHSEVQGAVTALKIAPDGTSFVTGFEDGRIQLSSGTGTPPVELARHTVQVGTMAFSPDAKWLVSADTGGVLKVVDLTTRQTAGTVRVGRAPILHLAFSPDSRSVVAGTASKLHLLNIGASSSRQILSSDGRPIALSGDGKRILTMVYQSELRLWDASSGTPIASLQAPKPGAQIRRATFSVDGTRIAAAYTDGSIQISQAQDGRQIRVFGGASDSITSLRFNADGSRLMSYDPRSGALRVWDVASGEAVISPKKSRVRRGYGFSADGRLFFASLQKSVVTVWDAVTGEKFNEIDTKLRILRTAVLYELAEQEGEARAVRLVASSLRSTRIWDVVSGKQISRLRPHAQPLRHVAVNADASVLMTLSRDEVRLWHLKERSFKPSLRYLGRARGENFMLGIFDREGGSNFTLFSYTSTARDRRATRHRGARAQRRSFNASYWTTGQFLDTVGTKERLRLRPAQQAEVFGAVYSRFAGLSWHAPHHLNVLSFYGGRAQVWSLVRGPHTRSIDAPGFAVRVGRTSTSWSTFTKDGGLLVRHNRGLGHYRKSPGEVPLWKNRWKDHASGVLSHAGWDVADLSPDERHVVAPSKSNTASIVDAKTGDLVATLEGHTLPVRSAVFGPQGKRILTTSADNSAKLWAFDADAKTVKLVETFNGRASRTGLLSGYFDSSGRYFVTSAANGRVAVWDTEAQKGGEANAGANAGSRQPITTLDPRFAVRVDAVGFDSTGECVFVENGNGEIQLLSRTKLSDDCAFRFSRYSDLAPSLAGYRLVSYIAEPANKLVAVTGRSESGTGGSKHSVLAIYNRETGMPIAVWKDPRSTVAGWANWDAKGSKLAVPMDNGNVHVMQRPKLEDWDAIIKYAETAAKPALLKSDKKRLNLLNVDEVIRLSN